MSLIELMTVVAIVGVLVGLGGISLQSWFADANVKGAARDIADAFLLGRSEAIRTGNVHLVVLQNALGAGEPVTLVDDGTQAAMNCTIDPGEVRHTVQAANDVLWGTSVGEANGAAVPDDPGLSVAAIATGSSFSEATLDPNDAASWVAFLPDGLPRLFTPADCANLGLPGQGGGTIYVTNQRRDYAVVLSPLGTVRVHRWTDGAWSS